MQLTPIAVCRSRISSAAGGGRSAQVRSSCSAPPGAFNRMISAMISVVGARRVGRDVWLVVHRDLRQAPRGSRRDGFPGWLHEAAVRGKKPVRGFAGMGVKGSKNPYIAAMPKSPQKTASSKSAASPKPVPVKPPAKTSGKGDHVFLVDGSSYIFRAYH